MKIFLTAFALVLAPVAAYSGGCSSHDAASRCVDGKVWDSDLRICVDRATS
jgi:hypothetical protein